MADLLSPENVDVESYLRGADEKQKSRGSSRESTYTQQTSRNSNVFPEHSGLSGPAPDLTWKKVQPVSVHNNTAANTGINNTNVQQQHNQYKQESLANELSEEQIDWLDQMVQLYGSAFERDQWIESFKAQNAEASANYLASISQSHAFPASVHAGSSQTPLTVPQTTVAASTKNDSGLYVIIYVILRNSLNCNIS